MLRAGNCNRVVAHRGKFPVANTSATPSRRGGPFRRG